MQEAELQEKLRVAPEHSKLLQIQIAKATTISKCLVDYAAFRTLRPCFSVLCLPRSRTLTCSLQRASMR